MGAEMWNPVAVETEIRELSTAIGNAVSVCDETYRTWLEADRIYDLESAKAYLDCSGPVHMRKAWAEKQTTTLRKERDIADAAHRLAERRARALENQLRAMQSIGASIRSQYGVAGRGEF